MEGTLKYQDITFNI